MMVLLFPVVVCVYSFSFICMALSASWHGTYILVMTLQWHYSSHVIHWGLRTVYVIPFSRNHPNSIRTLLALIFSFHVVDRNDGTAWHSTEQAVPAWSRNYVGCKPGRHSTPLLGSVVWICLNMLSVVPPYRGLLPGEKPELKRVLEQRRLEQHREQELALRPPLELETELRKRQQILLEVVHRHTHTM